MLFQFRKPILVAAASLLFIAIAAPAQAQDKFDSKLLKNGKYTLACYAVNGSDASVIGTFTIGINTTGDKLTLTTNTALAGLEEWKDTAISNLNNFKPVYRASHSTLKDMVLHFGNDVTGYYVDKKTKAKTQIKEPGNQYFIDSYTYPFLLSLLPLTSGYSTDLPVYEYKPENKENLKKAVVEEVKNSTWVSKYTGKHDVWEVTVVEPATDERSVSYIDKQTRRLWQVDMWSNGQQIRMVDTETDFNAVKAPFDKDLTMKMIKGGNSIIYGQVFARDFNDYGSRVQVMNIQAKQVAPRGTQVILIPYNDYFKEWIKVNESQRKKGREGIALLDEAAQCIKSTRVYDDEGHFEFVNLMPGEYLLYTEFGYDHSYTQTEVTGYTDHYINGMFQGTTANTVNRNYSTGASAVVKKVVTVSKPGEKVDVKLKKTRA